MRQINHEGPEAPVIIVTHDVGRSALDPALVEIAASGVSMGPPVALRIEPL